MLDSDDWDDAVDPEDRIAEVAVDEPTTAIAVEDRTAVLPAHDHDAVVREDDGVEAFAPVAITGALARDDRTEVFAPVGSADPFAPVAPDAPLAGTTAIAPAGSDVPARRRGPGWSKRVRWSVAASVVLLIAVVVGAVWFAQTLAVNNQAAQALAAAVAELEAAEADATEPYPLMEESIAEYDEAVLGARATADSAAPAFAAVAGMTNEATLAAANAALADLLALLDGAGLAEPSEPRMSAAMST